jgi:LysM repeat protein
MGIRKALYLLSLLLFSFGLKGQPFVPVVLKDGKQYHELELLETISLFSVSSQTGYNANVIRKENPQLKETLPAGTKLYLPTERENFDVVAQLKETVFGIAKSYFVIVDSLYAWNTGLQTEGLKIGRTLHIKQGVKRLETLVYEVDLNPVSQQRDSVIRTIRMFDFNDTLIFYQVNQGDKLSEIAKRFLVSTQSLKDLNQLKNSTLKVGGKLMIPVYRENTQSIPLREIPANASLPKVKAPAAFKTNFVQLYPKPFDNREVKIGVFLPFVKDSLKFPLKGNQKSAFEFYMGAMMGVDTLMANGLEGLVYFFDYKSKEESIQRLIATNAINDFDLFIAPWHAVDCEKLNVFALSKGIPMVLPVNTGSKNLVNNDQLFFIPTEMDVQIELLAKKIAENCNGKQVVFIQSAAAEDKVRENQFKTYFKSFSGPNDRVIDVDASNYQVYLKSNKPILYVSLSMDKNQVVKIARELQSKSNHVLFGLREWTDWKELNATLSNPSNFYFLSSTCFNYHDKKTIQLHKKFRVKYDADLSKAAVLGYDIMVQFPSWYFNLSNVQTGLMTQFSFAQTAGGSHTNYGLFLCRFQHFESKITTNVEWE